MIDFYTWKTPNGYKVSIMLEETGLPYEMHAVSLPEKQQLAPAFAKLNPNQRIPVIVDRDAEGGPLSVFESGAILIYLAEKSGKFLPQDVRGRSAVLQWLMFQMAGIGPMIGQVGYFMNTAEENIPYAIQRFTNESLRLVGVIDQHLGDHQYLGGDYSIADMATYPWIAAAWPFFRNMFPNEPGKGANVQRWLDAIAARPAVQKGMAIPT